MKTTNSFSCFCLFAVLLLTGCAIPQHFWPQRDIPGLDDGIIAGEPTVLIASRDSEYKQQLVAELHQRLSERQISHRVVGIGQLERVVAADYATLVIINTCLAWGFDDEVSAFVDRQPRTDNIILLTTSGEGTWLPDMSGRDFDAISGASVKSNIADVAGNLVARIQKKM